MPLVDSKAVPARYLAAGLAVLQCCACQHSRAPSFGRITPWPHPPEPASLCSCMATELFVWNAVSIMKTPQSTGNNRSSHSVASAEKSADAWCCLLSWAVHSCPTTSILLYGLCKRKVSVHPQVKSWRPPSVCQQVEQRPGAPSHVFITAFSATLPPVSSA